MEYIRDSAGVPRCACGGIVKPDVVLYEEALDEMVIKQSISQIQQADLLIVGGTSLAVYPAASFIQYFCGERLVMINRSATSLDIKADLVLQENLGDIFLKYKKEMFRKYYLNISFYLFYIFV